MSKMGDISPVDTLTLIGGTTIGRWQREERSAVLNFTARLFSRLWSGLSPIRLRSSPPPANFSAAALRQLPAPGPVLASLAQCASPLVPASPAQAKLSPPST